MTSLLSRSEVSLTIQGDALMVAGDLTMNVATEVAAAGVKWLRSAKCLEVCFDFEQVSKASSVAISVLFEWLRACQTSTSSRVVGEFFMQLFNYTREISSRGLTSILRR